MSIIRYASFHIVALYAVGIPVLDANYNVNTHTHTNKNVYIYSAN